MTLVARSSRRLSKISGRLRGLSNVQFIELLDKENFDHPDAISAGLGHPKARILWRQ
jgi:hypothetical protein